MLAQVGGRVHIAQILEHGVQMWWWRRRRRRGGGANRGSGIYKGGGGGGGGAMSTEVVGYTWRVRHLFNTGDQQPHSSSVHFVVNGDIRPASLFPFRFNTTLYKRRGMWEKEEQVVVVVVCECVGDGRGRGSNGTTADAAWTFVSLFSRQPHAPTAGG
jgi:hypothetical protein